MAWQPGLLFSLHATRLSRCISLRAPGLTWRAQESAMAGRRPSGLAELRKKLGRPSCELRATSKKPETPSPGLGASSKKPGRPSSRLGVPSKKPEGPSSGLGASSRKPERPSSRLGAPSRKPGGPSSSLGVSSRRTGGSSSGLGAPRRRTGRSSSKLGEPSKKPRGPSSELRASRKKFGKSVINGIVTGLRTRPPCRSHWMTGYRVTIFARDCQSGDPNHHDNQILFAKRILSAISFERWS